MKSETHAIRGSAVADKTGIRAQKKQDIISRDDNFVLIRRKWWQ